MWKRDPVIETMYEFKSNQSIGPVYHMYKFRLCVEILSLIMKGIIGTGGSSIHAPGAPATVGPSGTQ